MVIDYRGSACDSLSPPAKNILVNHDISGREVWFGRLTGLRMQVKENEHSGMG